MMPLVCKCWEGEIKVMIRKPEDLLVMRFVVDLRERWGDGYFCMIFLCNYLCSLSPVGKGAFFI